MDDIEQKDQNTQGMEKHAKKKNSSCAEGIW